MTNTTTREEAILAIAKRNGFSVGRKHGWEEFTWSNLALDGSVRVNGWRDGSVLDAAGERCHGPSCPAASTLPRHRYMPTWTNTSATRKGSTSHGPNDGR